MAHQNGGGASSVGNLYNNPIAAEAQYMQKQQQQQQGMGRLGSNGAVIVMDAFGGGGGGISHRQIEEPPIVPNHHHQVSSLGFQHLSKVKKVQWSSVIVTIDIVTNHDSWWLLWCGVPTMSK